MAIPIGQKIRALRKGRDISQEVLASALGVTFQAVSKWETGAAMPDVALIPIIAGFFRVSTDELFDFNLLEQERMVEDIVLEAAECRQEDPARAEVILRDGLRQFPGNEVLLNNLLVVYGLWEPPRYQEMITLARSILEISRIDECRYDALRILAESYKATGQEALVHPTLERIPEIYFTKLGLMAELLEGDESLGAARRQLGLDMDSLVDNLLIASERYREKGEAETALKYRRMALGVIEVFRREDSEEFERSGFYAWLREKLTELGSAED